MRRKLNKTHIKYDLVSAEIVLCVYIIYFLSIFMENIFSHGNAQQILKYGYFKTISTVEIFASLFWGLRI